MVRPFLPDRAKSCLRSQTEEIEREQTKTRADLQRLSELESMLRSRLDEAAGAGRDTRALLASLGTVQAALRQRLDLEGRLRALSGDIALDRLESEILLLGEQLNPGSSGVDPVLVRSFDEGVPQGAVVHLDSHPAAGLIAAAYERGAVRLLDIDKLCWSGGTIDPGPVRVTALAFARLHQMLAITTAEPSIALWDYASASLLGRVRAGESAPIATAWMPDSTALLTAFADGRVQSWSVPSLVPAWQLHAGAGQSCAIVSDPLGRWLALAGSDRVIRLCSPDQGKVVGELIGHAGRVVALAVEGRGRWLASCDDKGEVRVWTPQGESRRVALVRAQDRARVVFSPGGSWIVVTGADRVVMCKHQEADDPVDLVDPEGRRPTTMAVSPHGRYLAVGDDRGRVRLWDVRLDPAPWKVRDMLLDVMRSLHDLGQEAAPTRGSTIGLDKPGQRLRAAWSLLVGAAAEHLRARADEADPADPGPGAIIAEIDWLAGALDKHLAGPAKPAAGSERLRNTVRALRGDLPLRPLARALIALQERVAAVAEVIDHADEAGCRTLLGEARACASQTVQLLSRLETLAAEIRSGAEARRIAKEGTELSTRCAGVEDMALARLATLAVQHVSPIEDHAVIDRMRGARVDRDGQPAPGGRTGSKPKGKRLSSRRFRAVDALQRLDEREAVLRGARDELDRLRIETEAVDEVKKLRS